MYASFHRDPFSALRLLSSCYSRRQRLFIAPWLLWQPVIDKNMLLAAGELNPAELCGNTTMEGTIMRYWGGGGGW